MVGTKRLLPASCGAGSSLERAAWSCNCEVSSLQAEGERKRPLCRLETINGFLATFTYFFSRSLPFSSFLKNISTSLPKISNVRMDLFQLHSLFEFVLQVIWIYINLTKIPRNSPKFPKIPQNSPQNLQNSPKSPQKFPKNSPKFPQKSPKNPQNPPKFPKNPPNFYVYLLHLIASCEMKRRLGLAGTEKVENLKNSH